MEFTLKSHWIRMEGRKGTGDCIIQEYKGSEEYTKKIGPQGCIT